MDSPGSASAGVRSRRARREKKERSLFQEAPDRHPCLIRLNHTFRFGQKSSLPEITNTFTLEAALKTRPWCYHPVYCPLSSSPHPIHQDPVHGWPAEASLTMSCPGNGLLPCLMLTITLCSSEGSCWEGWKEGTEWNSPRSRPSSSSRQALFLFLCLWFLLIISLNFISKIWSHYLKHICLCSLFIYLFAPIWVYFKKKYRDILYLQNILKNVKIGKSRKLD